MLDHSLLIDDSLSLNNKTGARMIARDITTEFQHVAHVRRWRSFALRPGSLVARLCGRLMIEEISRLSDWPHWYWPERNVKVRLFLDPIYVTRSRLSAGDVVLVHDIGPITHEALYDDPIGRSYRLAYSRIAREKPAIVCVSDATKRNFCERFGDDFPFVSVIPLYARSELDEVVAEPLSDVSGPFLLSVGAVERRKNHASTIQAFSKSGLAQRGVTLILCGPAGNQSDEIEGLVAKTAGVKLLGYVRDSQLRWLYENARFLIFPSKLEGFGMPVLEAGRYGLPAITSDDESLAEAIGGLNFVVKNDSVAALSDAMLELLQLDSARRRQWAESLRKFACANDRTLFLARWRQLLCNLGIDRSHAIDATPVHHMSS